MQLPLEDVKILDLSHALAGPFCSTMLGDFDAQVVKVEVPGAGDIARGWGPPFYHTETACGMAAMIRSALRWAQRVGSPIQISHPLEPPYPVPVRRRRAGRMFLHARLAWRGDEGGAQLTV